tara:strand:+ start:5440 stop:6366 length:927 start_codon:yes stop_codon:yes gene_type:complete
MKEDIHITVLIPSYEYVDGISRIFNHFKLSAYKDGIDIIVFDDSKSDKIKNLVHENILFKYGKIKYQKNDVSLGAVNNWNMLIENAQSDYIFVLHQDECPIDLNFFYNLKKIIQEHNMPDLVFLRCVHLVSKNSFAPYFFSRFTQLVLKYFPQYLFLRNVTGSPSNIIVRNSVVEKFDNNLQWLVDVDWFFSMLKKNPSWIFAKKLQILSVKDDETSITQSISRDIKSILLKELKYLKNKHKNLFIFQLMKPSHFFEYFYTYIEKLLWYLLKIFSLIAAIFTKKKLPNWWKSNSAVNKTTHNCSSNII